jgi:hypothetical protein
VLDESRQDEAHRSRIAAKRIRYLLEPVRDLVPGAAEMIKELKGLQALLGEMHDAHILLGEVSAAVEEAEGDDEAGSRALQRRLAEERAEHFSALRERWLHGAAADLPGRVRALADELEGTGPRARSSASTSSARCPRWTGWTRICARSSRGTFPASGWRSGCGG